MTLRKAYSNILLSRGMLSLFTRLFIICIFITVLIPRAEINAQDTPAGYDEISVFINIPRIGGGEIEAVIVGETLYLPITNLFDFLKIRNIPKPDLESISGFFINPDAEYYISRLDNQIKYQGITTTLKSGDLIRTETNLFLKSDYFGKVFGLECQFNFRSLSVAINSKLDLPLIREMRQEEMRKNLRRLKGETKADTSIARTYPGFKFGMADWSVNSMQEIEGKSSTRFNLGLGAMIARGEASAALYYDTDTTFNWKYQQYLWRYVNNDFKPLRQISAGKINTNAISTIYNPVIGVSLTNTPTTYRRSFGTYTLSDRTEPGWIVELYVNNVLVDFKKADASGFFTFEVPLIYGNTIINLKFIGPWGEEKTKEQNINIPFTFLPVKTLEYSVNAGLVQDSSNSIFSRTSVNYGLSRNLTIGGGAEILTSVTSGPAMPYLNASLKITNNLLMTSEYTYKVRSKSTISYRLPSNMQLDVYYAWYHKNQTAIKYNYSEERKATFSMPVHLGKLSTYQRFSFNQIVLPASKYTTGEWLFSGSFFNINTNLTTYALFISGTNPNIYSNLALSFKLPAGIVCMPQVQYGYTQQKLLTAKIALQKHLFRYAYIDLSYERYNTSNINLAQLQFRYDFSFAQTGAAVIRSNKRTILSQYARGSIIADTKTGYIGADNRTNVGKGGISVSAFLDINSNGRKDAGEPKAYGLNLRTNGGRIEKSERDTTIKILGLEPYIKCFIELDGNSFENISWRLPFRTLNVAVDPNIVKNIDIPVTVVGEATGNVLLDKDNKLNGQGRIIINFYNASNKLSGKTLTEDDGYFSFFGLVPGKYTVKIDTSQMLKLRMTSNPESINFEVSVGTEGDLIDGLDFTLSQLPDDTSGVKAPVIKNKPTIRKDTTYMIVHEVSQELVTISEDCFAIQLGAFKRKANADALAVKLRKLIGKNIEVIVEGDFYKVRINDIKDRKEVDENLLLLKLNGISEVWVISLKAKQQQWVLVEKQDTVSEIKETIIEQAIPILTSKLIVQAGAFRNESNALNLRDKLRESTDKNIEIVDENGYFKVRISGFESIDEMEKLLPSLGIMGLRDIWILPVKETVEEVQVNEQAVVQIPVTEKPAIAVEDTIIQVSDTIKPVAEISQKVVVPAEKIIAPEPKISIQVAVFYKKAQALKAQRKIASRLKLKAEIIEQWDYYIVIIRGFFTRQETYQYYPELAGLGYPGVTLIEEK